jgi:hypothetical protein
MKRIGLKRNQRTLPWSGMSSERVGHPYRGLRWAVRWKRVLRALRHPSQAPIGVAGPIAAPEALSFLQPCRSVVPRTWSLARLAPALFEERPDLASYFLVLAAGLLKETARRAGPFLEGDGRSHRLAPTFPAHGACPGAHVYHRVSPVDIPRSLHAKKFQIDDPFCLDFTVSAVREEQAG